MKVKIEGKLPEGFKIVNGKVVRSMAAGGAVNHTLGPMKREEANLEAEKGETALTDLTDDGSFELYNIGGKRHSDGGTPLNLPEQSFVFSDTAKMKLTIEELELLGIKSKKKMTPADASKKFPLNKYIEILENPESDKISIATAEDMINKNKLKLSQIAFLQESKKDFADGLPLAAYPFLIENGINPQELEAKIQQQNQQNNQPITQDQMAMGPQMQQLQQFTGAPQGGMPPMGPPQGGMPPMPPGGIPPQQMPPQAMANMGYEMPQTGIPQTGVPQGYVRDQNPLGLPGYKKGGGCKTCGKKSKKLKKYQNVGEYNPFASKFVVPVSEDIKSKEYEILGLNKNPEEEKIEMGSGPISSSIAVRPRNIFGNIGARIGNIFRPDEMDVDPRYAYYDPATNKNIPELNYGTLNPGPLPVGINYGEMDHHILNSDVEAGCDENQKFDKIEECVMQGMQFDNATCDCVKAPVSNKKATYTIGGKEVSEEVYNKYTDGGTKIYMGPNGELIPWQEAEERGLKYGGTPGAGGQVGICPVCGKLKSECGCKYATGGSISPFKRDALREFTTGGSNMWGTPPGMAEMGNANFETSEGRISDTQLALQNILMYRQELMNEYQNTKAYISENPNAIEDPEKAVQLQQSILTMERQLQEIDVQTKAIQMKLMQESTQLDPFNSPVNSPVNQTQTATAKYGTELKKFQDVGELTGSDAWGYQGMMPGQCNGETEINGNPATKEDCDNIGGVWTDSYPIIGESEPTTATYKGNEKVVEGYSNHANAFNVMASPDFDPVRKLWIQKYRESAAKNNTGDNAWVQGKSDAELFMIFNKMNQYLSAAHADGYKFPQYDTDNPDLVDGKTPHERYGWGPDAPTEEEIKIFQGMYTSLNNAKIDDETGLLDQIVTTPMGEHQSWTQKEIDDGKAPAGTKVGDPKMVDANGNPVSFVDGKLGWTTGGQFYRAENPTETETTTTDHQIECDDETRMKKMKECRDAGKRFDAKRCDCAEIPGDVEEPKYPNYETFPQDDLIVANKSAQLAGLEQINPVLQPTIDPVLSDPMYVDPRQALSVLESTAAAAINANPDQATAIMGKMQDASEKVINSHHAMNTKIYNNAMNVNVPLINDAAERKSEAFKTFMDESNAARENFLVYQKEASDNLVDAVNTQMSNADEMYIRNLENPNYWFSPKAHNIEYYNQRDLDGNIVSSNPIDRELANYEYLKEVNPEFADIYYKNYDPFNNKSTTSSNVDPNRPSTDDDDDDAGAKLGLETKRTRIREADLLRSRRELRKWILGNK